jgi:hypothetical protein
MCSGTNAADKATQGTRIRLTMARTECTMPTIMSLPGWVVKPSAARTRLHRIRLLTLMSRRYALQQGVPLTPRHSAGIVGMWEKEDAGRVGIEWY